MAKNFGTSLKHANLASKSDIANLVNKTDIDVTLKNEIKKLL